MAYSILRNETKRNETKYMEEGEKMLINLTQLKTTLTTCLEVIVMEK